MKDNLVGCFGLVVGLRMSNGNEPGLAPKGAQTIYDLGGVKLAPVVENHCTRDAEADKLSNLGRSNGGNGLTSIHLVK